MRMLMASSSFQCASLNLMPTTKPTAHLPRSPISSSSPQKYSQNTPNSQQIIMPPTAHHCLRRSQRKLLLFFLKCIVMLAVISVFLFFLGFAAVVLLHFLLLSNRRRRRAPCPADESLSSLTPNVVYTQAEFPGFSDCAICLDSFEEGDVCTDLPDCKHLFHARCVDRWIEKRPTCPVCRTRVDFGSTGSGIGGEDRWKRLWVVNFEHGGSI